jgi:hypothetical protein
MERENSKKRRRVHRGVIQTIENYVRSNERRSEEVKCGIPSM